MSDTISISDILNTKKMMDEMPPYPISIDVSPEMQDALIKQPMMPVDGLIYLQGLPFIVNHSLSGNQYFVNYNKQRKIE